MSGWYRSHRAVQHRVSPKCSTYKHKMEWRKLIDVMIGLTYEFVHARTEVVLTFVLNDKRESSFRWKSKENLEKNCGIQFFFLVFLSFWTVCDCPKLKQQQRLRFRERLALFEQKKLAPVLVKNRFGFAKQVRFWENQPSTLGKSATDFGKISDRLWENQRPTLGKSATDFGKMSHRLWENEPPTSRK